MATSRDPDNINIYFDAAVYVANVASPTQPADISTAFGSTWDNLGVLNGEAGITNARTWAETKHFGWSIGQYRKGRKNYEETRVVTCLETNQTTQLIAHGTASSSEDVYVNRGVRRHLAFEFENDFGRLERWFTTMPADLWIPNINRNESDPAGMEVTCEIFANGSNKTYTRQFEGVTQVMTVVASSGTFTVSYMGATSGALDFDFTDIEHDTALEAMSTIGTGGVVVTGTAPTFTITGLEFPLSADPTKATFDVT